MRSIDEECAINCPRCDARINLELFATVSVEARVAENRSRPEVGAKSRKEALADAFAVVEDAIEFSEAGWGYQIAVRALEALQVALDGKRPKMDLVEAARKLVEAAS